MAEPQKKTNRELLNERYANKYPDRQFADDEELFGQVSSDMDDYEKRIGEHEANNKRLMDMMDKDPRSAQFLTDMARGKDPFGAVIERMGTDGIADLMNDPSKREEYAEANKRFLESKAENDRLEQEYKKNLAASVETVNRIQEERGLSDDQMNEAFGMLINMYKDAVVGKFGEESIDMALKAIGHDSDMQAAREEGTIAGRNSKINEKLRKKSGGDGMPAIAGSNNAPTKRRTDESIFGLANMAK